MAPGGRVGGQIFFEDGRGKGERDRDRAVGFEVVAEGFEALADNGGFVEPGIGGGALDAGLEGGGNADGDAWFFVHAGPMSPIG